MRSRRLSAMLVGLSAVCAAAPIAGATDVPRDPRRSFSVNMTGDIITESRVLDAGAYFAGRAGKGERYDFVPVLRPISELLRTADLAICHAEIPLGKPAQRAGQYGRSPYGGNLLLGPNELAADLRAVGFDRCSTASNHSYDLGAPGVGSTLDAFDRAGVAHVGTARSAAEASVRLVVVNGVKVAHLSWTTYDNTVPPSEPWRLAYTRSIAPIVGAVRSARAQGAEVVILSLHLRKEMLRAPLDSDRAFLRSLTKAAKIDLVLHHGPHVIQPVERVNGALVYWSVGNLLTGMGVPGRVRYDDPRTLDGLMAIVEFRETAPGRITSTPHTVLICNEIFRRIVRPAFAAAADPKLSPQIRAEMRACIARSITVVPDLI